MTYRKVSRPEGLRDLHRLESAEVLAEPLVGWPKVTQKKVERVENRRGDFIVTQLPIERAGSRGVRSDVEAASARYHRVRSKEDSRRTLASMPVRFPGKDRLVSGPTAGPRLHAGQTEPDPGLRTRIWIDGESYWLEEDPSRDTRPVASDPRFRRPETAPRLRPRTCSITKASRRRIDQLEDEVLPTYTSQGDSRMWGTPRKMEENILSQAAAATQGWIRSRLPEQDLGRRVQGWSGEDREGPYCFDRAPNKGARPVALDPRCKRPEAPRQSMGTDVFPEIPRTKVGQLRHGRPSHLSRPGYSQRWDRGETELSSGSEPEPALPDDQWAFARNPRKFYREAQANWQPAIHQPPPRRQHASKMNEGGSKLWVP